MTWAFFRKKFLLKFPENHPIRGKIMQKIDCAYSRNVKMLPWPWFRKIDICIEAKIEKFWNFQYVLISLNQDQGSIFTLRECAQSILRMKLPPEIWFWGRNFKIFRFSLQYTHLFSWIKVKEAFSRFGNARNRFFAWFYP